MKRILAFLCVIACLCGLCVPAMAISTVAVYVKAPADWGQVCLYVWEGDAPMTGWPGDEMVSLGDGLWTLDIPAGMYTNVIANNGSDAAKTGDLKMDGSADCWIDAGTGTVYTDSGFSKPYSAPVSTDLPMALVGTGIPGAADWAPGDAAGDMTKVSDGVYTKIVGLTAGSTMVFKVAGNDKWDDTCNFGAAEEGVVVSLGTTINMISAGDSKDMTLTVDEDCNLKFTVTLVDGGATLVVEKTDEEPVVTPPTQGGETTGETYTVYAQIPEDWKTPAVWCWNDSSSNPSDIGAWPGSYFMTKGDNGWWSVKIPAGYNNVLINANGGGVQTPDITGLSGQDVWINAYTDPTAPVFKYEEIIDIEKPAETEPATAPTRETVPPTEASGTQNENDDKGGNDQTVLWAIVGSVVIIAIAAVIIIIAKGKKKA